MRTLASFFLIAALFTACTESGDAAVDMHVDVDEGVDAASFDAGGADAAVDMAELVTAKDYCESIVDFFCPFYLRCGRMAVTTAQACHDAFLETCNEKYEPRYVELETAGLLQLSSPGIAACAAHLATVTCDKQPYDLVGPCRHMWTGTRPSGAACGIDVESFICQDGLDCQVGIDLCGSCITAAPEPALPGDACDDTHLCLVGTYCDGGHCVGPTYVHLGDTCDQFATCPYLSACVGGICVKEALLGEACSTTTLCASGICGANHHCSSLKNTDDACTNPQDCHSAQCISNVCTDLPDACVAP